MQIGDKKLVVQRASVGAKPGDMLMDQALEAGLAQPINIPGLCVAGTMQEATEVLCLMNMVTEEELMDDEEYEGEWVDTWYLCVYRDLPILIGGGYYVLDKIYTPFLTYMYLG